MLCLLRPPSFVAALCFALAGSACVVVNQDDDDGGSGGDADVQPACSDYCTHVVGCGLVDDAQCRADVCGEPFVAGCEAQDIALFNCLASASCATLGNDADVCIAEEDAVDECEADPPGGGGGGTGGPLTGVGASCTTDAQCDSGLVCVGGDLTDDRYCTHACSVAEDCADLGATTYFIDVAGNLGQAYNNWNSDVLSRLLFCGDATAHGAPSGDHCVFVCPENSAAVREGESVTACSCLPNFRDMDPAADRLDCQWDPSTECSIFTECNVTNTDLSQCSQGNFSCVVAEDLEGVCFDFVTGAEIAECVAQCDWDCDPGCVAGCGATPICVEACCTSSNPACN